MSKQSDEKLDWQFWAAFTPLLLVGGAMAICVVADIASRFGW